MTNGEADARHAEVMAEALACPGAGPAGDSRPPQFGEWLRGIWAGRTNPQRDGRYVRTVRNSGRMNPGTFYELTDGRGAFWQYPAGSTVFIQAPAVKPGDCIHCGKEICNDLGWCNSFKAADGVIVARGGEQSEGQIE